MNVHNELCYQVFSSLSNTLFYKLNKFLQYFN